MSKIGAASRCTSSERPTIAQHSKKPSIAVAKQAPTEANSTSGLNQMPLLQVINNNIGH